jgi:hypothetical protein
MAEVLAPAPDALSIEDLITQYEETIRRLAKSAADEQYDYERQLLLNKTRMQWMFVRGEHFNAPSFMVTSYGTVADYVPWDYNEGDEETGPDVRLCPPINFIGGDMYKFKAVMGQAAPRVKALPDDAENPDDMRNARNADVNIRDIWVKQRVDAHWNSIAFHQYTTGPAFIHTYFCNDATKYGSTNEPKFDIGQTPEGLPVPMLVGQMHYPNGDVEIEIDSVLEVAVPWQAKDLFGCDWLRREKMRSKYVLLDRYEEGDRLEQWRDGCPPDSSRSTSATVAAEVSSAVSTPSGVAETRRPNEWRHHEYWLSPVQFQCINEKPTRELFKERFPKGLYIGMVGDIIVDLRDENKCDVWAVCRVGRQDKINEPPICADAMPLQRAMNDLWGMSIETVLRAITQTIVDSQLLDRQAMNTNEAVPAEIIPTALPVDGDISKRIYQIPPARLSDQVVPLISLLRTAWQDITGIRPEISGGGQPTQTYHEAKQRRDQALAQLAPQAREMRYAAEQVARNAVLARARYGQGIAKAQRRGAYGIETDTADITQLSPNGWHCESDDNFPMTAADRRDAVFSMLKDFPPEIQQALSILDPMNIEEIFELLQVPGFESMVRDQVNKTLSDIQQLLQGQPTSTPEGPQPSIMPDPFENHAIAANVFAKWMVSETGRQARQQQAQGFANVEARWLAQEKLANPTPPLPPPLHGGLAITAKLEDFPQLTQEVLAAAGVQPQAPPPVGALPQVGPNVVPIRRGSAGPNPPLGSAIGAPTAPTVAGIPPIMPPPQGPPPAQSATGGP